MNKIMILGAGIYQMPIIEAAMKKGLYTIVVSPEGDYPGLKVADRIYNIDVKDEEKILHAAKKESINGITTDQTDIAVRTVAYVAEHMGLPGIGYECAKLFTDKAMMRKKSNQLGLPTLQYEEVATYGEARTFWDSICKSAIIKPVDNQGSRGITKIESLSDLKAAYELAVNFSNSGKVIIEEFISGKEFEVDSIVVGGDVKTLMYADLESFDIPNIFASTTRLYPSIAKQNVLDRLLELNEMTIKGFDLKQGLTHSEYIMDENDGAIYLLEAAARGGGTFISSHIAEIQTGIDTSNFLINIALNDGAKMPRFQGNQCHCGYVTFYLPKGKVISSEGCREVGEFEFVRKHLLNDIKEGMETKDFTDKTSRYAVIVKGDSRLQLLERIKIVKETLKIKVLTDEGIKGPIWN